jgi:heme oxygenase
MTDTIEKLEEIILTSEDENKVINAANSLSGVISRLTKVYEAHNLEKRVEELERKSNLRKVK